MNENKSPLTGEISENELGLKIKAKESLNITNSSPDKQAKKESSFAVFLSKIWSLFQFVFISTSIFALIFFSLNWSAYKTIIYSYFNPEAQKPVELAMHNAVIEPIKAQNLLKISREKKAIKKTFPNIDFNVTPPDNRIILPKIGKNIPLVDINNKSEYNTLEKLAGIEFEGAIQEALQRGVVHYPGTANPGQYGNFFATGHSSYYPWDPGTYKDVFALLEQLEVGDVYYVYFNQKKYTYKIITKKEVNPEDISVLQQPTDQKISTLMTCTPVGTDIRRLILQAEQV